MIIVGDRDRPVGVGAPTHCQVARRDKNEIAGQDAVASYVTAAEDRGVVPMGGTDLVHQLTHGKHLANGPNEQRAIGLKVYQGLASIEVIDTQSPDSVFVERLVEYGLDISRDTLVIEDALALGTSGRGNQCQNTKESARRFSSRIAAHIAAEV